MAPWGQNVAVVLLVVAVDIVFADGHDVSLCGGGSVFFWES